MLHDVRFLDNDVELDRLTAHSFVSGSVFVISMEPLYGILFEVSFKYFTLLRGVSCAMQQECFFCIIRLLAKGDCIFVLGFLERPFSELLFKAYSPPF